MVKATEHQRLALRRSPRWAFMEKFQIPNYDDDAGDDEFYLTRWRVVQTPWFAVFVHRFDGPDSRPTLHDHPWNFLSLVLWGGYVERRLDPATMQVDEEHRVRWVNRVRTHDAHAIVRLLRVPTWSLLFVGRRVRKWGYLEPVGNGEWVWTEFDRHRHAQEFDAALARRAARAS